MTAPTPTRDHSTSPVSGDSPNRATYTTGEVAVLLGVSKRHVERMNDAIPGRLPLGGRVLFARAVIDRWLGGAK